jgi:NarL family two-component system response regulator LiaR
LEALEDVLRPLEIDIVAKTTSFAAALEALETHGPDLFLADFGSEDPLHDADCVASSIEVVPELKVIVLSDHHEVAVAQRSLSAGAAAYVLKTADPGDVVAAVHQAFEHSVFFTSLGATEEPPEAQPANQESGHGFTRREVEILKLLAEGYTNAQLARMLWVSEQTVKFHLSNIYRKLDVTNRTEASRWAQLHGLLDQPIEADKAERP